MSTVSTTPYAATEISTPATLATTATRFDPRPWIPYEHLLELDRRLVDVAYGRTKILIVSMPPQHGKSELISHWFPTWLLGIMPEKRVILASYSAEKAQDWGRAVRNEIRNQSHRFGVAVDPSSSAARRWNLVDIETLKDTGGGMYSVGVRGGITGRACDIGIIDDPVKDNSEALNDSIREGIWTWYKTVFSTRLSAGAGVVIVMTRWHTDDLVGKLKEHLDAEGEEYDELVLPAIAEEDDPIGRQIGEALCPELHDLDFLEAQKALEGSFWFSALYQQSPSPAGGGIFKLETFNRWQRLPRDFDEVLSSWDMSFKDTEGSSFVVGQAWGKTKARRYLLDQVRGRWDFTKTKEEFRKASRRWYNRWGVKRKLIEDKANGPAIMSALKKVEGGMTPVEPQGSKIERAYAVQPECEAGDVYLPAEPVHDQGVLEDELTYFPRFKTDDCVDTMTQALLRLQQRRKSRLKSMRRAR